MAEGILMFCAMTMFYIVIDRCLKCIEKCSRYKWYYGKRKFYSDEETKEDTE